MAKSRISQEIKTKLFSADATQVIAALNSIRTQGNKDYLPLLFDVLAGNPAEEIRKEILKVLGTVKDPETIPVFAEALREEKYTAIRKNILITCWQNGLDFSSYVELFVDLIVTSDWEIAFEAFTVIENLEHFPAEEEMKPIKLKIAAALKSADDQKAYFLEEILKLAP